MNEPTKTPPGRDDDRGILPIWRVSSVGIELGVAVVIGWAIGWWLDQQLGTDPWLMILFVLFGVAAGFKGVLAATREMRERDRQVERQNAATTGPRPDPSSEADRSGR